MSGPLGGFHDGRLGAGDDPGVERRIGLVGALLAVAFVIFAVRLFQLQIIQGADLRNRSERNFVRTVRLLAPRGEIVDRNGRVVATSRPAFGVGVIPSEVQAAGITYEVLGRLLEREPVELASQVGEPRGRERFQAVVLDSDLSYDGLARVESHRYALPGVVTDSVPRRHYPEHDFASHLLGTIGEIQQQQLSKRRFAGYRAGEVVGQRGLERELERHLRGRDGGRNLVVNVAGREVEVLDEVKPEPGGRVVLTLDIDLQRAAEEAFRAPETEPTLDPETGELVPPEPDKMGALVALDPRNGDVLALVSRPAYDPNAFAGGIDSGTWRALMDDEWRPLQDRALSGVYPPGSTYKAVVAAAGLAEGVIDPEEKVLCPGHYRLGRRVYRCWRRGGHGPVNLWEAIRGSCDVYFYELGLRLGIDTIARYARAFGLGQPTGIDLPGEKAGLVPSSEWKERARGEPWIKGETVSAAIGQGYNLTTPLQMAVAYAAIANGGVPVKPRTILRLEDWQGELVEVRSVRLGERVPVDDEHLQLVRDGLTAVVMDPKGTGRRARVPGVNVAGKTGTSQVVRLEHVEGLEDDEIPIRYRDHAWFAAFAPAEDPEIVVVALVEHGGSGGSVAAPVAQKVLARYFEKKALAAEPEVDVARD
ncbi:MAG: penicillin-binding protein 2 [Myxococcota bacterium]